MLYRNHVMTVHVVCLEETIHPHEVLDFLQYAYVRTTKRFYQSTIGYLSVVWYSGSV